MNIYDLGDTLVELEGQNTELQAEASAAISISKFSRAMMNVNAYSAINNAAGSSFVPVSSRLATLEVLAADFSYAASADSNNYASKVKATVSNRVAAEATNRGSVTANLMALVNTIGSSAGNSFTSAQNTRAAQLATMTSTRTAILNNANMNFAAAVAAENARATQETTDFNNQLLDATTAAQASIDAALTAEPSRADAFCDSSMTGVILTNSTGNTNDYASW